MVSKSRRSGFSLLEMVLVLGIMGAVALLASKSLQNLFQGANILENKMGFAEVRQALMTSVDCNQTLTSAVLSSCGPYIELKNISGTRITGPLETGGAFAGAGAFGRYHLRARCDATSKTLVVQVAQKGSGPGGFAADPQTKVPLDFSNPKRNPIFGPVGSPNGATPMCQSRFLASGPLTLTCPSGQTVSGFDTAGNVICVSGGPTSAGKSCAPGFAVKGIKANGDVDCVAYQPPQVDQVCPLGKVAFGVRADGQVLCAPPGESSYYQLRTGAINFLITSPPQKECGSLNPPGPGVVRAHYFGAATCPKGWMPMGGTVDCQPAGSFGGTTQATGIRGPISATEGGSYLADCCLYVTGTIHPVTKEITYATPGSFPGMMSVTCINASP